MENGTVQIKFPSRFNDTSRMMRNNTVKSIYLRFSMYFKHHFSHFVRRGIDIVQKLKRTHNKYVMLVLCLQTAQNRLFHRAMRFLSPIYAAVITS